MLPFPVNSLLVLLLTLLFLGLLVELAQFDHRPAPPKDARHSPRPLRPRTPDDCALCRTAAAAPASKDVQAPIPYAQLKSSRGRKKRINTAGYACPHPDCRYFNHPNPAVHALVGYGHHGTHDSIQDLFCQACRRKFSAELAQRLALGCLPVFSRDGLALYFYALTAHFGHWVQAVGQRSRRWQVEAQLLYGQLIKRYRRRRLAEVRQHVYLGSAEAYRQALRKHDFSGRIQTAFVERLNLTIRRSIAGLARRSWSMTHSLGELAWHFEWWRAYYHFARPHASLRQLLGDRTARRTRQRYRSRTPAQAAALTDHRWTVQELLACPALPLTVG